MKSNLTWRRYEEKDWDAVVALHHEQELGLGRPMDLPDIGTHPVLVAMVAERDGEVVGCYYFESVPELVFVGRDPEVTASAKRRAPKELGELEKCGFRIVRLEAPRFMNEDEAKSIAKELERTGFESTDGEYTHYKFDLRPGRV